MLGFAGVRLSGELALGWPWLGVGLVVVGALFFVAVSRLGAPVTLWYLTIAFAALHVLAPLLSLPLLVAAGDMITPLQLAQRFVQVRTPYLAIWFYAASPIAYLATAFVACRMGASVRRRRHA